MARSYTLKRRAEQQAETRQRIVEAAVELHGTLGPSLTTISMVAERAGVQRHTFYAHFPDERSLFLACSGLVAQRDPLPDPEALRAVGGSGDRLRAGIHAMYEWYARNERLAACILRDAEHHALTREMVALRREPRMQALREVLGAALGTEARAVLRLMLGFHAWRSLVRESGLEQGAAVEVALQAIECAGRARMLAPSA
jgi:AcrR family transcriptional regulator